jgi:predicted metal-dependent phosphoesterase TrpH
VADTREAFDRFLAIDGPAFISRPGSPIEFVVGMIHNAGGLASLAHPGRTRIDERIPALAAAGLDALEVYHSDHDAAAIDRYHRVASDLGLLMTGGSDFHGDPAHGIDPGTSTLPYSEWQRLLGARRRHAVR